MSLYNGLDLTAIATLGVYSNTYGSSQQSVLGHLYASLGLLEGAMVVRLARRFYTWVKDSVFSNSTIGNI